MGINLRVLKKCRSRYVDQLRNIIPDDALNEKETFRLLIYRISVLLKFLAGTQYNWSCKLVENHLLLIVVLFYVEHAFFLESFYSIP